MDNEELDLLIKEKMQKYVPDRPVQVLHGGAILLLSMAIGAVTQPTEQEAALAGQHWPGAWLGVYLAVGGLVIYVAWTRLRIARARKEANEEFLAASLKKSEKK
jgi:uncharacterized integral membrane protein